MGRNRKARQEWDKAMQESGQPMMTPPQKQIRKRSSGRIKSLSKAMRIVDDDIRKQVLDSKLMDLEKTNYDDDLDINVEDEDEFTLDDEESSIKNKRSKRSSMKCSNTINFNKLLLHEIPSPNDIPNYYTIVSQPSKTPLRKFCAVCGKPCNMSCIRCGTKFCSLKCQTFHNETKCLKFGTI